MNTAFYVGQLSHARLTPKPHRFSYQVFMPFVDVDDVETLTDNIPLWSRKRLAPARFVRSDFIGPQDMPISDAVKARILEAKVTPISQEENATRKRTTRCLQNTCFDGI